MAAIVVVVAVSGAVMWAVWRSPQRSDLSLGSGRLVIIGEPGSGSGLD